MRPSGIQIHTTNENMLFPKRSTFYSAGYDIYAPNDLTIQPRSSLAFTVPLICNEKTKSLSSYTLMITVRSSYGLKKKLRIQNEEGLYERAIFSSTTDTYQVNLFNDSDDVLFIPKDEHFLQIVLIDNQNTNRPVSFEDVSSETADKFKGIGFTIAEENNVYTLFANEDVHIRRGEQVTLPIGKKARFSRGDWLGATIDDTYQKNIVFANGIPVIDADYYNNADNEGLIFIGLVNISKVDVVLSKETPICQFIAKPFYLFDNEIEPTSERSGGIGSTSR